MKKVALGMAIVLVGTMYALRYHSFLMRSPDTMTVAFLDVGQGDAVYIRAPNGNDVLIDGGPDDSVMKALRDVMPPFDQDIGMVIATHPDKDHIAGLAPVFDTFDIRAFLSSEKSSGTSFEKDLQEKVAGEEGLTSVRARRGQRFILDARRGAFLDILFPDQDTSSFKETNKASIIVKLTYHERSFMLTGDAYVDAEEFLVEYDGASLRSDVLKLGHHGSTTSTSDTFLTTVRPTYAIVSAGKDNSYKHPAKAIVERVSKYNIKILSTIDQGTIVFETNGRDLWIR